MSMEKMVFKTIREKVEEAIDKSTDILIYDKSDDSYPYSYREEEQFIVPGAKPINKSSWSRSAEKYRFIYKVIFEQIFYTKEAERLRVNDAEIQNTYTKFVKWLEVYENFEFKDEYDKYLNDQVRQVYIDETRELEEFLGRSLLEQLKGYNKRPEFIRKSVSRVSKSLKNSRYKFNQEYQSFMNDELSGTEIEKAKRCIKKRNLMVNRDCHF